MRQQPALLAELPLRAALSVTAFPLGIVYIDRLLERQSDLHPMEPELLLQVFDDIPGRRWKKRERWIHVTSNSRWMNQSSR